MDRLLESIERSVRRREDKPVYVPKFQKKLWVMKLKENSIHVDPEEAGAIASGLFSETFRESKVRQNLYVLYLGRMSREKAAMTAEERIIELRKYFLYTWSRGESLEDGTEQDLE